MSNKTESIQVPAFELPASYYLQAQSPQAQAQYRDYLDAAAEAINNDASIQSASLSPEALRQHQAELFYQSPLYRDLLERYPCRQQGQTIAGVYCEIFTPQHDLTEAAQKRVLINLHGGAFESGSRTNSHLESIPVASLGGIKVISIDYRMAPEHVFPAASDDVIAVYKALLNTYSPANIGLYGGSAGGRLSAQVIARLQQDALPLPAAVAMIAGATQTLPFAGDSSAIGCAIFLGDMNFDLAPGLNSQAYFKGADRNDPLVVPAVSDAVISRFPPSLLISSSRDFSLSPVLASHRQLVRLGVETELHIWDGLNHVFHYNPLLPETRELHELTLSFFNKHLGQSTD